MLTEAERKALLWFAKCDRNIVTDCRGLCQVACELLNDVDVSLDGNWAELAESLAYSNKSSA